MLQTQLVDLKFGSGADTKTDNKNTLFTNFVELKNSRMDQLGAVVPRGGLRVLGGDTPFPGAVAFELITNGRATVAGQGTQLTSSNRAYGNLTTLSPAALKGSFLRLPAGESQINQISIAASATQVCMAWVPPSNATDQKVGFVILDAASGEIVSQCTSTLAAVQNIKVVADAFDNFYIVCSTASSMLMSGIAPFDYLTPFQPSALLSSPTGPNLKFDALVNGSTLHIVYSESGTNTVTLYSRLIGSPTATTSTALTFASPPVQIAMAPVTTVGGATISVFGMTATELRGALFNSVQTQIGTTQVQASLNPVGSTVLRAWAYDLTFAQTTPPPSNTFAYTFQLSSGDIWTAEWVINATTNQSLGVQVVDSLTLAGTVAIDTRPVTIQDAYTYQTYGTQAARIQGSSVGTFALGANLGQLIPARITPVPVGVKVGSKTFFAVPYASSAESIVPPSFPTSAGTTLTQVEVTPKVQASILIHDTAETPTSLIDSTNGQAVYIGTTNRVLNTYNTQAGAWPELSIRRTPDVTLLNSGGNYKAGTMSFVFAKVVKTSDGSEYRTYGPIYQGKVDVNYRLQYAIRAGHLTNASSIELYRTEANGTIFYKADTRMTTGTFQDNSTDDQLLTGRLADLNGAELAPEAIPTARVVTMFKDRIALVTPDKPSSIYFHRPAPFPVGTSFSSGIYVDVPSAGGPITAMVQMDSALYVFKSNSVYTIYGDAPGATGENGTLTLPQLVFNGVGVTSSRGIILTPQGIVMKTGKGFYMIARNQQLGFIGDGPYEDKSIVVTGVGISQAQNEVYFAHSNGSIWVLNLDNNGWYEWVNQTIPRAMTSFGNILMINTDGGNILDYSEANIADKPAATEFQIPQVMTTGWVKTSNIRGFQRVRRAFFVGERIQACTATIEVMVDYKTDVVQTFTITTSNIGNGPMQFDLHLAVQKCEAMAFRITTNRVGVRISGATLELGIKEGPDKSRSTSSNFRG